MSRKNGDRARFNRQRNEKIQKRASIRDLRKALHKKTVSAGPSEPSGKSVV